MINPIVSILCTAYNHALYIRECLDGFVMQKTNFPFEVIVHDDASTDETTNIIKEYEKKYPEIIKPIYQKENQYSLGIDIWGSILLNIKGKYIAICEGDDYWISPNKLQKQIDFLEKNKDFSICFHPVKVYDEAQKKIINRATRQEIPGVTNIKTLAMGNFIDTPSVVYRRNEQVLQDFKKRPKLNIADYYFHMLHAKYGKIKKINSVMAVYRVHDSGIWSKKTTAYTHPIWLKLLETLIDYFKNEHEVSDTLRNQYIKASLSLFDFYFKNNNYKEGLDFFNQIYNSSHELCFDVFKYSVFNLIFLKKSKSYRIGRIIIAPLRFLILLLKNKLLKSF